MGAGEGHAIIGANGFRQAEVFEGALEDGERVELLGAGERFRAQQIAGVEVAYVYCCDYRGKLAD